MEVTLRFPCGVLGYLEIQTNTDHGNPDFVWLGGVDISADGPFIDSLMLMLGERYTNALKEKGREITRGAG